jgi:hypothetical protein
VLPQPPPVCQPPVALPAPSGKGAMLVDAASGRLEWVQPSGAHPPSMLYLSIILLFHTKNVQLQSRLADDMRHRHVCKNHVAGSCWWLPICVHINLGPSACCLCLRVACGKPLNS